MVQLSFIPVCSPFSQIVPRVCTLVLSIYFSFYNHLLCYVMYVLAYFYSTVTAEDVSVDSSTPQPTCSNDTLTFNCQVNFGSFFIRWNHTAFKEIEFLGIATEVGNTNITSDGQVVANLTRKTFVSTGLYLLSSTLIIHPPLNSIDFNNTNITCEGNGRTVGIRSDLAPISLYGEQLRLCLIMHDYLTHCLCMYPLQVSLPLLMT